MRFDQDTVWLSQAQMAELFEKDVRTINEHVQNIFKEEELLKSSTYCFRIGDDRAVDFYSIAVFERGIEFDKSTEDPHLLDVQINLWEVIQQLRVLDGIVHRTAFRDLKA